MKIYPSKAKGKIIAPPSKSLAHRYLICGALVGGKQDIKSAFKNLDYSDDINATLDCIKELFINRNTNTPKEELHFNCRESGSTLRFFIPLFLALNEDNLEKLNSTQQAIFTGSKRLMVRPLSVYENIFQEQGIKFERKENELKLQGKLHSGEFRIPGDISSQFVSGLLFALPLLEGDSKIIITGDVESLPYINMTIQVQKEFGINIKWEKENEIFIFGRQEYKWKSRRKINIEGDYSNAAFFDVFNFLGGKVKVYGLNKKSLQGDKIYLQYFRALEKGYAKINLTDCPDLTPILFVMAALKNGGEFTGTKRLEYKESNRGLVMCEELAKFGIKSLQEENRIVIYKGIINQPKEKINCHDDHRIVMSLVTLLSITGGEIEGVDAVNKSLPRYFKSLEELGILFIRGNSETSSE